MEEIEQLKTENTTLKEVISGLQIDKTNILNQLAEKDKLIQQLVSKHKSILHLVS